MSARNAGFGQALPDGAECVLDEKNIVKPDACLVSWRRLEEDVQPYGPNDRPLLLKRPELVVESRSPANRRAQEVRKRAQYFAQGTEVVWDVDEENKVIYVYRADAPGKPLRYGVGDEITCEPFLPKWRRRVADIFDLKVSAEVVAGEVAEEWRNEGIEIGREIERYSIARALLANGLPPETVARLTNLSLVQVQQLT